MKKGIAPISLSGTNNEGQRGKHPFRERKMIWFPVLDLKSNMAHKVAIRSTSQSRVTLPQTNISTLSYCNSIMHISKLTLFALLLPWIAELGVRTLTSTEEDFVRELSNRPVVLRSTHSYKLENLNTGQDSWINHSKQPSINWRLLPQQDRIEFHSTSLLIIV